MDLLGSVSSKLRHLKLTSSTSKQYTALISNQNQIRLLHLEPASRLRKTIICHTTIVSLADQTLEYEALSYVWGDRTHGQTIQLDHRPWTVSANLFQAFLDLRYTDRERILWVDAICIDQRNLAERSEQVSRMHDIFARASTVLIWLGPSSPDIPLAWQFFQTVGSNPELHLGQASDPITTHPGIDFGAPQVERALQRFMGYSWWTRIWTAQEWLLAKSSKFHCGRESIDGDLVLESAYNFSTHVMYCCRATVAPRTGVAIRHQIRAILSMREILRNLRSNHYRETIELLDLLGQFRSRQASDPRDKIYGILALAPERKRSILEPDYTMTVEQVYENWTLAIIQHTKNLDILSYILVDKKCLETPSWVPDWTIPLASVMGRTRKTSGLRAQRCSLYKACGNRPVNYSAEKHRLTIEGVIVDTVAAVANTAPQSEKTNQPKAYMLNMIEWEHFLQKPTAMQSDADLNAREAFWMTLCGSMEWETKRGDANRLNKIEDYTRFENWWAWARSPPSTQPGGFVRSIDRCATLVAYQRTFMVSQGQLLGWAPKNTSPGDVIAVLTGGRIPMVLRPGAEGYTVLGDAYVQGIMDGEAMKDSAKMEYVALV